MSQMYFLNTYFILPELFLMHPVHSQILYEGRYSAALFAGCVDAQLSADLVSSHQPSSCLSKMDVGRQVKLTVNLQNCMPELICKLAKRWVLIS